MLTVSRTYGEIDVSWSSPSGNWATLRVVRNTYGTPVSHEDGLVLVHTNSGPAATGTLNAPQNRLVDRNLTGGRFYYYAVWLYVPSADEWTRAAHTVGLAVSDYGYSDRLWELTPGVYRTQTTGLLDNDNETLRSYYRIHGFQLDHIRAEYETLRQVNDPYRVSGNLLPLMSKQWGQFFEPELGMAQMRKLLASTVYLYRNKGTVPGIEGFIKAISGYGAKIQPLKNLMLDYNDSSFEESIGRWVGSNCTLSRYVSDSAIAAAGEFYQGQRQAGLLKIVATTTTAVAVLPSGGASSQHLNTIPVEAGLPYSASYYTRADTVARASRIDIQWYSIEGVHISTATAAADVMNTVGSWTRVVTENRVAPAGAARARLVLQFAATVANEVHYVDAIQFEQSTAATDFEDARLIDIDVLAPRVNLATNPNFESSTAGWGPIGDAVIAQDTTRFRSGAASLSVTLPVGAVGTSHGAHYQMDLEANTTYTVSGWVYVPAAASTTSISLGDDGTLVDSTPDAAASFSVTKDAWFRVWWTVTTAADGVGSFVFRGVGSVAGDVFNLDDVMVEKGAALLDYFDGTTHAFVGDSLWEGAANLSRSHYYPQRRAKNFRMYALLPKYTPMGSSARLTYALTSFGSVGPAPAKNVLLTETWTGADGSPWPSQWVDVSTSTGASSTIVGGRGRLASPEGASRSVFRRLSPQLTNVTVTLDYISRGLDAEWGFFQVRVRANSLMDTAYIVEVSESGNDRYLQLKRIEAGTQTNLGAAVWIGPHVSGELFHLKAEVIGSDLRAKTWKDGTTEPAWQVTATDTVLAGVGFVGLVHIAKTVADPNGATDVDNFVAEGR